MTVTPYEGISYWADTVNRVWQAPGWPDVPFDDPAPPPPPPDDDPLAWDFNIDEPWRLNPGESLLDGIPAGVPIVNASDYSTSTDIYTILQAVETQATQAVYVRLAARTYFLNQFRSYGTNSWIGFANSNRRVMGLIGQGVENGTRIQAAPSAVTSSPGAAAYVLNPPTSWAPVPVTAFHLSNTNTSVPLFITGIDFAGTLQTPFGVYSSAVQSAKFRVHQSVPSPLAWSGLGLFRSVPGSRIQFCRFSGFAYALNSSPPFETAGLNTNYGQETVRRVEVDGRIAADLDAARPLAAGGYMVNKGIDTHFEDSYLHHTRRSGWATNTDTNDQSEVYGSKRVRVSHIASQDGLDGYAGDNGLFNASNVEEVVGTFTYDNCWLSTDKARMHINLATPHTSSGGSGPLVLPTGRPIIKVPNGFKTDDTLYGGCLRIGVSQTPNSTGTSPAWQKITDLGIAGSGLFDIRNANGVAMTGVKSTAWTSSMKPDTHFVVAY